MISPQVAKEVGNRLGEVEEVEYKKEKDDLSHDLKHCAVHYAVEKKGGRIEYQYGDFLRAMEGRPRAPGGEEAS
nr:hypothetical protein CFP56_35535 [Quercus suber]